MFLLGLAIGAALGLMFAGYCYDRGITRTNRQWVARAEARYRLSKIVTGAD